LLTAWKSVAATATRRAGNPAPKPRRRSEETGGAFRAAARHILRRAATGIPGIDAAAVFLSDTLDWLNLWYANAGGGLDDGRPQAEPNRLSPYL